MTSLKPWAHAALAAAVLAGSDAAALQPGGPIQVVTGTVDFGASEGSDEFVGSKQLLASLPSAPEYVYLDLAIAPAVIERTEQGIKLDFSTVAEGPDGQPLPTDLCVAGQWRAIPSGVRALTLTPASIDPHISVRIDFGTVDEAPYNALSCDYAPAIPDLVVIRVTGFFIVHETVLPNARSLRLMPFEPPYEAAAAALAQSIAAP